MILSRHEDLMRVDSKHYLTWAGQICHSRMDSSYWWCFWRKAILCFSVCKPSLGSRPCQGLQAVEWHSEICVQGVSKELEYNLWWNAEQFEYSKPWAKKEGIQIVFYAQLVGTNAPVLMLLIPRPCLYTTRYTHSQTAKQRKWPHYIIFSKTSWVVMLCPHPFLPLSIILLQYCSLFLYSSQ